MKSGINVQAIYNEFLSYYTDPTLDEEKKLIRILQTAEKHKLLLDSEDKAAYLKNRRIINAQRDNFLDLFDIDDVISVKADLSLFEESDEDSSENSISSTAWLHEEKSAESDPIPDPEAAILTKSKQPVDERKKSSQARSEVTIQSPEGERKVVYFEHNLNKSYLDGCTARVKKVFDTEGKLTGAVKIMFSEILAKNEARINRLLPGRSHNTFYGSLLSSNQTLKWYVFMPWLKGEQLATHYDQVAENAIKNPSLSIRLMMAKQAFSQVKFLHDKGLILGDIHCGNFIIDTEENKLHIIDLASVHGKNDDLSQKWLFAPAMLPQNLINLPHEEILQLYSQTDDIFALGITISELFCEAIKIIPREFKKNKMIATHIVEQSSNPDLLINKLIFLLMEKMTDPDNYNRLSIDECLTQIEQIIELQDVMDNYSQILQQIAHQDGSLTDKNKLIDHQFKSAKKIFKQQLINLFGEKSALFLQLYPLAKNQLIGEANSSKRQADRLRVTSVEELTARPSPGIAAQNPCRFSWSSNHQPSLPEAKPSIYHNDKR